MEISVANANSILKKGEPIIGASGFAIGATQADIKTAMDLNLWEGWDSEKKLKYIMHNVASRVAGLSVYDDLFSKGPGFTFKATGFINKGLALYIGAEIAKELKLPYYQTIHKSLSPFGLGMAIGGLFDPPLPQSQVDRLLASQKGGDKVTSFNKQVDQFRHSNHIIPTQRVAASRRGYWSQ